MSATYETVGEYLAPVFDALDRHAVLVEALCQPGWATFETACLDWSYNNVAVFRHPEGLRFFMTQVYKLVSTSAGATRFVKEGLKFMQEVQNDLGTGTSNTVRNRALLYSRWIESQLPEVMGAIGVFTLRGLRDRLSEVTSETSDQARTWMMARANATILDSSWHSRWATEMVLQISQRNRPDILEALRILVEQVARRIHRFESVTFQTQQARTLRELVATRDEQQRQDFLGSPAETIPEIEPLERIPALLEKEEKGAGECLGHLDMLTDFARDREVLSLAQDLLPAISNLVHQRLADRRPVVDHLRNTLSSLQIHQNDLSPLATHPGSRPPEATIPLPSKGGGCATSSAAVAAVVWMIWQATAAWAHSLQRLGGG